MRRFILGAIISFVLTFHSIAAVMRTCKYNANYAIKVPKLDKT